MVEVEVGGEGKGKGRELDREGERGPVAPRSDNGVKIFGMAQFNVFTPTSKRGGEGISGSWVIAGGP